MSPHPFTAQSQLSKSKEVHTPPATHSPQHKDADCGESEEGRDVAQEGHPGGLYRRTDAEGEGQVGSKEI